MEAADQWRGSFESHRQIEVDEEMGENERSEWSIGSYQAMLKKPDCWSTVPGKSNLLKATRAKGEITFSMISSRLSGG